jgi:hypothetical protein
MKRQRMMDEGQGINGKEHDHAYLSYRALISGICPDEIHPVLAL